MDIYCAQLKLRAKTKNNYYVHRFIWECYNGLVPVGLEIDHINDNRSDNRLCNLQLVTPSENKKKAAKNTDYSFTNYNYINKKSEKAINLMTDEVHYFPSMYSVQVELGVSTGVVKKNCDREYGYKRGRSKVDGYWYSFEYLN